MKAQTKAILFVKATIGGKPDQRPVGVFANEDKCRPLAVAAMTAYKAADLDALKALGFEHLIAEDGKLHPGFKFSKVTVPYEPEFTSSSVDPFA